MQPDPANHHPANRQPAEQPTRTAAEAWQSIFTSPHHNGQTWACLAVAIAHADDVIGVVARNTTAPGPSAWRGSPLWTNTAVSSYQLLTRSDAYRHQALDLPAKFVADEPAIHTWLHAPDIYSFDPHSPTATVADLLHVDTDFLLDDDARPGRLARLVEQAQRAGVLRCPHMHVEVWHLADNQGDLVGHRVAVHHDGGILASEHFDATDLIDESRTGIDAAAAVLREIATVATRLVATDRAGGVTDPAALGRDNLQRSDPKPGWAQGFRIGARPHHQPTRPATAT